MKITKDILRVEKYRPNPADPNFVVDVTTDVIDHWSRTFNDMKNAEIGIPLTFEHPPKDKGGDPAEWKQGDPRFRAGWVDEVYRDGNTLMAVLDVPDDYGADLIENGCYVSPKFGGTWTDSLSRKWENPIHHIALTTKPVAVNQSRVFTPTPTLAFSRDGELESPFSHEMFFSTSQGQFAQWSQPEDTEVADLSPAEAIDRLFENPNFVAEARQRLAAIPEQQFSADPSAVPPGMPAGMPQGLPEEAAPEPEPDGGGADAAAVAMQILHEVMQACAAGMKAMAQLGGVATEDDEPPVPPPAAAAPAPALQAQPAVTSMSRDEIESNPVFAAMEHKLTQTERKGFADRVNALFDSGRCTAPHRDGLLEGVGKYEFSRQTDQPNVILLEKIALLESMPEHAALPLGGKETEFSRQVTATAQADAGEMTDERAEQIVHGFFGIKK